MNHLKINYPLKRLLLLFIILVLAGCNHSANDDANSMKPAVHVTPAGDKIIFLDNFYSSYLKAARAGSKNYDTLYSQKIDKPIYENYFSASEYAEAVKDFMGFSIHDTAGIQNTITGIENNKEKIENLVAAALQECRKYLKIEKLSVFIKPVNGTMKSDIKKMGGVMSLDAGSQQIIIVIDPTVLTWSTQLEYCVANEYMHAYCTKIDFSKMSSWTLLHYMVYEGKGDAYAHLLFPGVNVPWTNALSESEKGYIWSRVKMELLSEEFYLNRGIMYGNDTYPQWSGFTLGYNMMQAALKNNPKLTPEEWVNLSPEKVLTMSDYEAMK